ncbi:MAG: hypothetical protein HYX51_06885 [Chloroflexi bacterium]|nr:hypothetical protein [Chloroflexota bacterium]
MTTIYNSGVLGILINYAPNFGVQSGLTLQGGAGLGPVNGLLFNNSANFGFQTGLLIS